MQQSAAEDQLLPVFPKFRSQLFVPQIRPPAQSLSRSQSPFPMLHGRDDEQQDQSVDGIPSQLRLCLWTTRESLVDEVLVS